MSDENWCRKVVEHLESCSLLAKNFLLRDFLSRFYYSYIFLLDLLGYRKNGWHDLESYEVSENFQQFLLKLNAWRTRADYQFFRGTPFPERRDEVISFLLDIAENLLPDLIEEVESSQIDKTCKRILTYKLEELYYVISIITSGKRSEEET